MKITIVQTEIEEAIRALIRSQITIKPGMVITMELRATRGDEGFIANIDISPDVDQSVKGSAAVAATAAFVEVEPMVEAVLPAPTRGRVAIARVAPKEPPTPAAVEEARVDDTETPAISTGDARVDKTQIEESDNPPLRPSIFSNLRRPSNAAVEEDAMTGAEA